MSFENHQLLYPPFSQNHFFKHLSGVGTTPRFSKAFSKLHFSVPNPRVLAPLEGLSGDFLLINKPLLQG
jgi:hypothetical protein